MKTIFEYGEVNTIYYDDEKAWRVFLSNSSMDLRREVFTELKKMGKTHSIFINGKTLKNYVKVW